MDDEQAHPVEIVTAIQETLGNSTLTVRFRDEVIGTVLHDSVRPQRWIATLPPVPDDSTVTVSSRAQAIDWLVQQALKKTS